MIGECHSISKLCFIEQLVHMSACVHRDMKHMGSLESMKDAKEKREMRQEARVALGYASSNSYTSFVLSKLPVCFIYR